MYFPYLNLPFACMCVYEAQDYRVMKTMKGIKERIYNWKQISEGTVIAGEM